MEHRFYKKCKKEQIRIQAIIAFCAMLAIALSVIVSFITGFYPIAFLVVAITLSIIAPFFDVPSLNESGKLVYFSPLFVTEQPQKRIIKVHSGTLFDYVFVIKKEMNGKQRTSLIIQQYLQGLICLIEKYEADNNTDLKIQGTSYILNERTAKTTWIQGYQNQFHSEGYSSVQLFKSINGKFDCQKQAVISKPE